MDNAELLEHLIGEEHMPNGTIHTSEHGDSSWLAYINPNDYVLRVTLMKDGLIDIWIVFIGSEQVHIADPDCVDKIHAAIRKVRFSYKPTTVEFDEFGCKFWSPIDE
jgi:hypothetical protein